MQRKLLSRPTIHQLHQATKTPLRYINRASHCREKRKISQNNEETKDHT